MNLTPAQQKALDWLPSDGAWRTDRDGALVGIGFTKKFKALAQWELMPVWDEGRGHGWLRYRLTPKGIAYKAGRSS